MLLYHNRNGFGIDARPRHEETSVARIRATTILAVRHNGKSAIGGDGQVTLGNVVMKGNARKIRPLYEGKVMVGFAGAAVRPTDSNRDGDVALARQVAGANNTPQR